MEKNKQGWYQATSRPREYLREKHKQIKFRGNMKISEVYHKTERIDNYNRETQTKINNQSSENNTIATKDSKTQAESTLQVG